MCCKICGSDKSRIKLLGQNICKDCISEISNIDVEDESYDFYKNMIRIFLGYYISDIYQLNPVN